MRLFITLLVFGMGYLAGALTMPLLPSNAEIWIEDRVAGLTSQSETMETSTSEAVVPLVTPDAIKPSNTLFEVLPISGSLQEQTGWFKDPPPWVVDTGPGNRPAVRAEVLFRVRNLSTSTTLKAPYWTVRAFGQTETGWVAGLRPDISVPQVDIGETDPLGSLAQASFPPGIKAVRFTISYNEPGMAPSSATIEYPWR